MSMPRFRSEFDIRSSAPALYYGDEVLFAGSCFSEHIAQKMDKTGWTVLSNPNGIMYHPLALSRVIRRWMSGRPYDHGDVIETPRGFASFDHHGVFASSPEDEFLRMANESMERARGFLSRASLLVLTWGSAYGYRTTGENGPVANCHRLPGGMFDKTYTEPDEIIKDAHGLVEELKRFNPGLQIEITVSPVRHLRDGVVENLRSKSALIVAAHAMASGSEDVHYFPSYELIAEDLKDYRWYESDLMHPTRAAIDYVWVRYRMARFEGRTHEVSQKVEALARFFDHRGGESDATHRLKAEEVRAQIAQLLEPWKSRGGA
jgi:hypothetical protein